MATFLYIASVKDLYNVDIYNKAYSKITEERKNKTNRYKVQSGKVTSVTSEILLKHAIFSVLGKEIKLEYKYLNNGKPYLKNDDIYFNISHSFDYVIVAISNDDIGCDIEFNDEIDLNVAKKFFSIVEYNDILNNIKKRNLFYRYWTLKESFVKATGIGFKLPFNSFTIHLGDNIFVDQTYDQNKYYFKELNIIDNYSIALCSLKELNEVDIKFVDLKTII